MLSHLLILAFIGCSFVVIGSMMSLIWNLEPLLRQVVDGFERLSTTVALYFQNSPAPVVRNITPSSDCKSSPDCRQRFTKIMETMSLGATSKLDVPRFVQSAPEGCTLGCVYKNFSFDWKDSTLLEKESYAPLVEYIIEWTKANAKDISTGKDLPAGFFYEVEIHTLRPRVGVKSNELRLDHLEPTFLLHLHGRSDVVVWDTQYKLPGRTTTRYCIEVKTMEGMKNKDMCLREAFLQLIGLNAYNDNKSPAVILTNLNKVHFVLYLALESNIDGVLLQYNLIIHKFSEFAHALWFAEKHLGDRSPCCKDLFRAATPESTGRLQQQEQTSENAEESDDDGRDHYGNVALGFSPVVDSKRGSDGK